MTGSLRAKLMASTLALTLVAACGGGGRDIILPGERLDIRADLSGEGAEGGEAAGFVNQSAPLALPTATENTDWTHRNGAATHRQSHPALAANLTQAFAVNIGEGNSRRARITADPVVSGGRVFAMDAASQVTALSTDGAPLWSVSLVPARDRAGDASGGGLAVSGTTLFVTTGFGELVALDVETGAELWAQDLDAPGGSAPTVVDDLVYVVSRNNLAWAIDASSGRIRWTITGTPSPNGRNGGAGVAATSEIAIFPFSSGEVVGAFPLGGLRRWASVIAGERLGHAASTVSDVTGDPVIVNDTAYVSNIAGRLVALDIHTGDRHWTAVEGAVSPVWPAGDALFLINDLNELVRLNASDGSPVWRIQLPEFEQDRERRQKSLYAHYGPVLAGGRLIVGSGDGVIRQFDPTDGSELARLDLPGGATSNPVVAGGTLYMVSARGQLLAFR